MNSVLRVIIGIDSVLSSHKMLKLGEGGERLHGISVYISLQPSLIISQEKVFLKSHIVSPRNKFS